MSFFFYDVQKLENLPHALYYLLDDAMGLKLLKLMNQI